MRDMVWVFFGFMFGGQMAWLIAAAQAEKWLKQNDPDFRPPGVAARLLIGRLFTSFRPMARYGHLRRERGEPTSLVAVFWIGFSVSMAALMGVLASLGS